MTLRILFVCCNYQSCGKETLSNMLIYYINRCYIEVANPFMPSVHKRDIDKVAAFDQGLHCLHEI